MKNLSIFLLLFTMTMSAQKIDKSKNELKSTSSSSSSSSSTGSSDDDDGDFISEFIHGIENFFRIFVGFYSTEEHLYNNVSAYPYADSKAGNYSNDTVSKSNFRIDFEDQYLHGGPRMFGNHMKAKIRPFQYFYVQADYRELFERTIENSTDNLSLLHLTFCYDRLRFEKVNLGWNLGVSYVGSGVRKAGFGAGLSADYFPGKRISFTASAKWSRINTQPVNTYEFASRFHHKQFFFTLGFQHLKIATPTYNFVTVGGGFYL